jgi:DNA polymerase-3 subunit alpha
VSAPGSSFVHLHLHSTYSLLDGAIKLAPLVRKAREDGMPAIAVTDHGNLYAAAKFYSEAKSAGIKPILGCEIYVAPDDRLRKEKKKGEKAYFHLILLAQNSAGYKNLLKLVSEGYTSGFYYKPRIDKALLKKYSEGIIALSACLGGEVQQAELQGNPDAAEKAAADFAEILPDRFYLEIQRHGLSEQEKVLQAQLHLAKKLGLPLAATNDCHFLEREDYAAHKVLLKIGTGGDFDDSGALEDAYTAEHYVKRAAEMRKLFSDHEEALDNTEKIAESVDFQLDTKTYHIPSYDPPAGKVLEKYLDETVRNGLAERLAFLEKRGRLAAPKEKYAERLETELAVIHKMNFESYFLIVWDFIREARVMGVPVGPGRGSAAGSLVAYSLRITDLDPLRYGLFFERFLNPERISMPDIDIDFCEAKRHLVIEYVKKKYGEESVVQIATFAEMKAKLVLRDVARGRGWTPPEADKLAKLIPEGMRKSDQKPWTLAQVLEELPEFKRRYDEEPETQGLINDALKLEGLARHVGIHAAGIVITPGPVTDFAPLAVDKDGNRFTQYAKDEVEKVGLLKMDFLGLTTLTLIERALGFIRVAGQEPPDLATLELDDPAVFRIFAEGKTNGVFQFESSGMKQLLTRFKPEKFEDLIALNALFRPGPMQSGMMDQFVERKHDPALIDYMWKELEPVLKETYGVIAYQEQVMQIAAVMAGFSLAEADHLRKAMGKKKAEEMAKMKAGFVTRSVERGVPQAKAEQIYDHIEKFAGYGFNKSHSAAYALVAYHTAYLKVHHPAAFMAALLTSVLNDSDMVMKYLGECKALGLSVLPPDINESQVEFLPVESGLRFGLLAIKGVGRGIAEDLVAERGKSGRFTSLTDLALRLDEGSVNKRTMEALIKAGATAGLNRSRRAQLEAVEKLQEESARERASAAIGQNSLFGGGPAAPSGPRLDDFKDLPEWPPLERLRQEKESLGFYFSGHPLGERAAEIAALTTHTIQALRTMPEKAVVVVGGLVAAIERKKSRAGDNYGLMRLEDTTGSIEVMLFKDNYAKHFDALKEGDIILVVAEAEPSESDMRLFLRDLLPLDGAAEKLATALVIEIGQPAQTLLDWLKQQLATHPGRLPVYLEVAGEKGVAVLKLGDSALVKPSPEFLAALRAQLGDGAVRYRVDASRLREGVKPRKVWDKKRTA